MRPDPLSLQLLIAVVEHGSIAAAAQREHIAAAAVSRRMAELEEMLGCSLLVRHARGIEPTPAGLALSHRARGVLQALDDMPEHMRDFAQGLRGQVRVFANISAITQFLPADLWGFTQGHPEVRLMLEESNSSAAVRAVAENAADVAVYTAYAYGDAVESLPYRRDRLAVVVGRGHPLARRRQVGLAELLEHPFVGLRTGSAINLLVSEQAARLGRMPRWVIQVTGFDALCLMAAQGFGIGLAPVGVARLFASALGVREIALDEPWTERELRIAVRSLAGLSPAARRLVEHLQATARQGGQAPCVVPAKAAPAPR